jgi:hypothetical protein
MFMDFPYKSAVLGRVKLQNTIFFIFHLDNDRRLRGMLEAALCLNNVLIFILLCLKNRQCY